MKERDLIGKFRANVMPKDTDMELVQGALATIGNFIIATNATTANFEIENEVDGKFIFNVTKADMQKRNQPKVTEAEIAEVIEKHVIAESIEKYGHALEWECVGAKKAAKEIMALDDWQDIGETE